jgi:UDP-N-acetylmuramoylalanine--D-glutamate ligase
VRVESADGRTWIDDSKATNVHAASATLSGLEGPVVLLVGGSGKDEDYAPLAAFADRVRRALCFGAEGPRIAEALSGSMPCETFERMAGALERAAHVAEPGDTILLSPACASFDEFSGFAERGEVFAQWVGRHVGGAS